MSKRVSLAIPRVLSDKSITSLKKANFDFQIQPLIRYEYLLFDTKNNIPVSENYYIVTSIHALYALERTIAANEHLSLEAFKIFCIEGRTSNYAKKLGLHVIDTATNGQKLAKKILESPIDFRTKMIHLTSNIRLDDWKTALSERNLKIVEQEVYRKTVISHKYNTFDGALFFSPSQGKAFLKENSLLNKNVFCIGNTTADFFISRNIKNVIIADVPSEFNLIETVIKYYNG